MSLVVSDFAAKYPLISTRVIERWLSIIERPILNEDAMYELVTYIVVYFENTIGTLQECGGVSANLLYEMEDFRDELCREIRKRV